MSYFAACLWGLLLLTSFVGWGSVVAMVLSPDRQVGWGERAAWGMAALVVVGGILNLMSWATRPVLLVIVGLGVARVVVGVSRDASGLAHLPRMLRKAFQRDYVAGAGAAVAALAMTVLFLGSASSHGGPGNVTATNFNPHDDFQAYFVFAEKIAQTGGMGVDPFSERRLTAGLGGETVLQALVLAAVPLQHLHLLDPALGIIIAIAIVAAIARSKGLSPRYAVAVVLFVLAVAPPTVNTTAVTTALTLMLALGAALESGEGTDHRDVVRHACLVALLVAALCALKSSLLVPALVAMGVGYAGRLTRASRAAITGSRTIEFGGALVLVTVLLAPFMLSLHRSSGTFLYPILGRGYRGVTLDPDSLLPAPALVGEFGGALMHPAFLGYVMVGCACVVSRFGNRAAGWIAFRALAIGGGAGVAVVGVKLAGADLHRYTYAFMMPAMALGLIDGLRRDHDSQENLRRTRVAAVMALCGAALFVVDPAWRTGSRYREFPQAIASGLRGPGLVPPDDVARLHALQRSVPPGAPILARLEWPFLLDFARNPVFVNDWPGGASPPPGMPAMKGAEPVAEYLRALGIHYLAYSYAHEAGFSRRTFAERLDLRSNVWNREQAFYTFEFQEDVAELGRLYRHVYDDGDTFMLDLTDPVVGRVN